jgi:hypothetical protein
MSCQKVPKLSCPLSGQAPGRPASHVSTGKGTGGKVEQKGVSSEGSHEVLGIGSQGGAGTSDGALPETAPLSAVAASPADRPLPLHQLRRHPEPQRTKAHVAPPSAPG